MQADEYEAEVRNHQKIVDKLEESHADELKQAYNEIKQIQSEIKDIEKLSSDKDAKYDEL